MKRFLVLFIVSVSAYGACDYTIRDRMYRTPEQQRQFRCDLNWRCIEAAVSSQANNLDELETLSEYSRNNRCNDELRLADLMRRTMSQASSCDISLASADMEIVRSFTASDVLGTCGPDSPEKLLRECREAGFRCEVSEQFQLNNPQLCSAYVTGVKRLPDTDAGRSEARCEKIRNCYESVLFGEDRSNERELSRVDGLARQNNCPNMSMDSIDQAAINQGQRGNQKADLPVIPDAPTSGSQTTRQ